MKIKSLVLLFILGTVLSLHAAEYYVAPNGSPAGNGSKQLPWDLKTAFNSSAIVRAGDTVWLRGGTYGAGGSNIFTCNLGGLLNLPVTIREYPGEHAKVDGSIVCFSSYVTFWGFEITNSNPNRKVQNADRPSGMNLYGLGDKAINLVVHDAGHPGIGFWNGVGDSGEIYGCLIWGNGLYDLSDPRFPDGWTRGSSIYAQNKDGTRYIKDTIAFRNFTTGIDVFTENAWTDGFYVEGNINFDHPLWNIWFTGGGLNPMQRLKVLTNFVYQSKTQGHVSAGFGYSSRRELDLVLQGNYFVGGSGQAVNLNRWADIKMSGNTIVSGGQALALTESTAVAADFDNNTYYDVNATSGFQQNTTSTNFAGWKALTGFDAHSTFTQGYPTGVKVFVRPNKYETRRAHIVVYNWSAQTSANVDLSTTGLKVGDPFEIRDVQNYYGTPVVSSTYTGAPVTVPLNLTQVAPLTGTITHFSNVHTPTEFNTFVLLPAASTAANTAPTISTLANLTTIEDTATAVIPFTVGDVETPVATLTVSASSANPTLVPNSSVVFGGSGASRSVTIIPATNQTGSATITLTVSDGSLTTNASFTLTVTPVNDAPTISVIADQVTSEGVSTAAIPFTIGDVETVATNLTLAASSSNKTLVPDTNITLAGSGANRTILLKPAAGQSGTTTISVTINDGTTTTTKTFSLKVNPANKAPATSAGLDQTVPLNTMATLRGTATDDGLPNPPGTLTTTWSLVSGPGTVIFANTNALVTTVSFSAQGIYRLRLIASDGLLATSSDVSVSVTPPDNLGPDISGVEIDPITSSNAVVSWVTSVAANSQVQYSLTTNYSQTNLLDPLLVTSHSALLSGLLPNTAYHLRLLSANASGKSTLSGDYSFNTPAVANELTIYQPFAAVAGTLVAPMASVPEAVGSLQRYVTSITGGEGKVTYQIYVPEAGSYIVWCRVLAKDASSDSFYVSMDGGAEDVYDAAETTYSSLWRWTKINGRAGGNALTLNPRVFTLTAGLHTLVFRQRDPNTGLSRLIVTNDRNFVPADNQPVAGIGTGLTLSNLVLRTSLGAGYSMIANPLSRGGNTVAEVLANVPNGTQLYKYNPANGAFINNVFQAGSWSSPSQTLSPGEGAFIYNTSGSVISLTFTGSLQVNNSPLPLGPGMNFLSAWYPRTARISEIVNSAPVEGDRLYLFDNGSGNYLIYSYNSEFGGWGDIEPIVRAGSSFYYFKNSNP